MFNYVEMAPQSCPIIRFEMATTIATTLKSNMQWCYLLLNGWIWKEFKDNGKKKLLLTRVGRGIGNGYDHF